MKLIAFAGSNSSQSINKKLAVYAASLFTGFETEVLDLNDFTMPLFSVDLEKEIATPQAVGRFLEKISSADLIVISLAENNSSFNAAFKNLFDWNSRVEPKQFYNKPMLLMATSPGGRGGTNVLEHAKLIFPRHGADIKSTFSLPAFHQNFEAGRGITNVEYDSQLRDAVMNLQKNFTS